MFTSLTEIAVIAILVSCIVLCAVWMLGICVYGILGILCALVDGWRGKLNYYLICTPDVGALKLNACRLGDRLWWALHKT